MAQQSPKTILQIADAIRNPADSYKMRIRVKTDDNEQLLDVSLSGPEKTLIITQEPFRDRGRNMLMLDRDFYAYVPSLKRALRLSLAQKLSGQVANGDISRTRWHGDYSAVREPSAPAGTIVLLLEGLRKNLTYQKIRLHIDEATYRPQKAEYLAVNGKRVLKTAYFEDYRQLAGSLRPGLIRIIDTNQKSSTIEVLSMEPKTFPASLFTEKGLESRK